MRKITTENAASKPLDLSELNKNQPEDFELPVELAEKLALLQPFINNSNDLVCRRITLNDWKLEAAVIYLEGIVDNLTLNQNIIQPLLEMSGVGDVSNSGKALVDIINSNVISVGQIRSETQAYALLNAIFDGYTVVLIDSMKEALVIDIRAGLMRGLDEPLLDKSLTGPREGFTESLVTNTALIRRKLRDPRLVIQKSVLGKRSRSTVALLYIEDIANPQVVQEVKRRLGKINIDGVLASGYISPLLDDDPYSVFPLNRASERPDIVVADLLEGRVAIIVDQSPLVILYPALFVEMFQAAEDYYEKTIVASFWRLLRFFGFITSISLPAAYIALLSFQPEMIPLKLLSSLARSRAEVPFPVFTEAIIMEIIIQMVIEAGLRLPPTLAQTIGIVSGIILGQAAISAKLASPAMIVVITLTTMGNFCTANFHMAMTARIIRIPMLILAAMFGTVGLSIGSFFIITHLASLESMGMAYLSPLGPTRYKDLMNDSLWRNFIWKMKTRPQSLSEQDMVRQGSGRRDG